MVGKVEGQSVDARAAIEKPKIARDRSGDADLVIAGTGPNHAVLGRQVVEGVVLAGAGDGELLNFGKQNGINAIARSTPSASPCVEIYAAAGIAHGVVQNQVVKAIAPVDIVTTQSGVDGVVAAIGANDIITKNDVHELNDAIVTITCSDVHNFQCAFVV